jgi:hypothetical protein
MHGARSLPRHTGTHGRVHHDPPGPVYPLLERHMRRTRERIHDHLAEHITVDTGSERGALVLRAKKFANLTREYLTKSSMYIYRTSTERITIVDLPDLFNYTNPECKTEGLPTLHCTPHN